MLNHHNFLKRRNLRFMILVLQIKKKGWWSKEASDLLRVLWLIKHKTEIRTHFYVSWVILFTIWD